MAGYWPSYVFVFLWTESECIQEKNQANMDPAILPEQAWSIKDLLY